MLDKAIPTKSDSGFDRAILTNKPKDKTYQTLLNLIIKDFAKPKGLQSSELSVRQLVVCDGWARALLDVSKTIQKPEQVILQKLDGKW
ncbi:MAG: hypothetical protein QME63_00025 [Actinomycetota bacterium]|nr:hypothetical protein [Actinomycetota bacterium]